jgi:hypothetical protein
MIGWLILITVTFILTVVFAVLSDKSRDSDNAWQIPAWIFGFICFVFIMITAAATLSEGSRTVDFIVDKAYYESYGVLPENGWRDEKYGIADANQWLWYAKSSRETHGMFSLYPAKVEQLEPIK